jgi:predicted DNA-binding protein YlxM (UPF0122 family)
MDETVFRTLLFDFYGELLTGKQREYYDLHYNNDLSLFEIAEMTGTSRQAVWDVIRRAEQSLRDIEARTGLIARAQRQIAALRRASQIAESLPESAARRDLLRALDEMTEHGI